MARTNTLSNFLTDVANAIRTKKGTESTISASAFDTEILNLPGGTYQTKNITVSANGSQTITPDQGYDAIDEITITTQVPQKQLQTKSYNFTQNTTIQLLPDTGYDGFDQVNLDIDVQGETPEPTTATVNDVINPKSFYSNGQKLTGAIVPGYGDVTLVSSGTTVLTTDISARTQDQIIQDINYNFGIAVRLETNALRIYKIIDGHMNTSDSILLTIPNRTFGSGTVAIVPRVVEEGYAHIIICACNAGNAATYFASMYKIDLTDYTLSDELAYSSNVMSISRSTEHSGAFLKWQESIHFFDNNSKFICCLTQSSGVGYTTVGWKFHYTICSFTTESITKLRSTNIQFTTVPRGDDWDNSYPRKISSYINGNYLVYKVIKNYRGSTMSSLFYTTLVFNVLTYNLTSKVESSDIGYDVANDILYGNNLAYNLNTSTNLGSCNYTANLTKPSYAIGKYIISCKDSTAYVYETNNTTITNILSQAGTRIFHTADSRILIGYTSFIELVEQAMLISFNRAGITYYSTNDSDVIAENVLSNKIAYNNTGKITGTMLNNGTLNYTPATSSQSIPAGYTSGGTISAVTSAIDPNIQSGNIKSGVTILGIEGTYEGSGGEINNQDKTITQNGEYTADSGYTGIGVATVNVPIENTSEYSANIQLAEQILGLGEEE